MPAALPSHRPPRPSRRKHATYDVNVFINCPFDKPYEPLFRAMVFTIFSCGYIPHCAKEESNQNQRFQRIISLVGECRYGIHDLSRIELDKMPRNNMPLELGLFIGCQQFGTTYDYDKEYLVLDSDAHRYNQHTSDIKADDAAYHKNDPNQMIKQVRDWLASRLYRDKTYPIPGAVALTESYKLFKKEAPAKCRESDLNFKHLLFNEFSAVVSNWTSDKQAILKGLQQLQQKPKPRPNAPKP